MKEFLEFIIKNLVENQEAVSITESQRDDVIVFEIKVEQSDMGRIIGKQGRIAKAIRTLSKAISAKENKKVLIDIVD